MFEHWFWLLLIAAVVIWYSVITAYVAFMGIFDIKKMLTQLSRKQSPDSPGKDPSRP